MDTVISGGKKSKMEPLKNLVAIDSHTMGEPTRVVVEGFPRIDGATMMEKKRNLQKHYDFIRKGLMEEPRGHRGMFGAVLLEPTRSDADLAVVFMDSGGYLNMCGHGSIGVTAVAVRLGMVPVREPVTELSIETPSGLVHTKAAVRDGRVTSISLRNVPAFLYAGDVTVEVPSLGPVKLDIAFGGNFFAVVDAAAIGLPLTPENTAAIRKAGGAIRRAVNRVVRVRHPEIGDIRSVDLVEFYAPAVSPGASLRNCVFFGKDQLDRSPCGTGTSAKMAVLYAKKELGLGEDFVYESILGTRFRGRILSETTVGRFRAVVPEVTGNAYVTGRNVLIFDEDDPFRYGFELG